MVDNNVLTQLGVGGILALLVLREVFNFLQRRNGRQETEAKQVVKTNSSGEKPPDFWLNALREITRSEVKPILEILQKIQVNLARGQKDGE